MIQEYKEEGKTSYRNQLKAGFQPIPFCIYRRNTDEWGWWHEGWQEAKRENHEHSIQQR